MPTLKADDPMPGISKGDRVTIKKMYGNKIVGGYLNPSKPRELQVFIVGEVTEKDKTLKSNSYGVNMPELKNKELSPAELRYCRLMRSLTPEEQEVYARRQAECRRAMTEEEIREHQLKMMWLTQTRRTHNDTKREAQTKTD